MYHLSGLNRTLSSAVVAFVTLLVSGGISSALAQSYPSRHIELVVSYPPGGTSDISARLLAAKWTEFLGQTVIVVNKPGANGAIGTKYVATAKPDGHTLNVATDTPMIAIRMMQDTGYDLDSFTYLFAYAKGAQYLMVKADSRWKTLKDFIDDARQRPMALTYSSYGDGTVGNFSGEMVWRSAGVKLLYIPFKSSPEAANAVAGGQVDIGVIASTLGLGKEGGRVRVLATMAQERQPQNPNLPTVTESGYPVSFDYFSVVIGPKGLPAEVIEKLLGAHRSAYAKYKDEINTALLRMELVPTELDSAAIRKTWGERERTFRELAPAMRSAK